MVKKLEISNRDAQKLLIERKIYLNGEPTSANLEIKAEDEILYNGNVLQAAKIFKYIAFYKPRGIETTLNQNIGENLANILPFQDVFPVGRLDKASEGLLLLTDDGRLYDKVLRNEHKTEKEYQVQLDKPIDEEFLKNMANGVKIMGKTTLSCRLKKIDNQMFSIVLVQGLNRQIRRMCYKLGYEVLYLKRNRIGNLELGELKPGEWRHIDIKTVFKK
ncbi:pseudouridine synthase [Lacihabitans sp. LS3-19]|uniref:pseudouridine synthase n=1 Tax=Lacihabitans sp. LS3-19 TaxID=2487335 RepID=UPI0020CB9E12|nr:pseudouridine synthase [Lacihabitans sp. LS3-19]